MNSEFKHIQAAHCENGTTTSLLRHYGYDFMTEPLAFGIGSGLFYIHIPFISLNNGPAISFRTIPGRIFKRTCRALDVKLGSSRFRSEDAAKASLDAKLDSGLVVGCQVGVYNLTYFPPEYRFHFNAHNLIIYGREGDEYCISDPVMEGVTRISAEDLNRVRFAKGMYAPRGHIYYLKKSSDITDDQIRLGISRGIKRNVNAMLKVPGSFAGVTGIKYTGEKVRKLKESVGLRKSAQYLSQIVRMQEEIGTGGGGFRFIYAAFLQEADKYFQKDSLIELSDEFTRAGDLWRDCASNMIPLIKGRSVEQADFDNVADMMANISNVESQAFKKLSKVKLMK